MYGSGESSKYSIASTVAGTGVRPSKTACPLSCTMLSPSFRRVGRRGRKYSNGSMVAEGSPLSCTHVALAGAGRC